MVKRRVVWSQRAKRALLNILTYYNERNKSNIYSIKLNKKINRELLLLVKLPEIGFKVKNDNVRRLVIEKYILFYEITFDTILILII